MTLYEDAKSIFFAHNGDGYYMSLNGVLDEYKRFNVPKDVESEWLLVLLDKRFSILSENECNLDNVAKFRDFIQLLKKVKKQSLFVKAIRYLEENFDKYDSFASVMLLESGLQLFEYLDAQERCVLYQMLLALSTNLKRKHYSIREMPKFLSASDVSSTTINKRIDRFDKRLKEHLEECGQSGAPTKLRDAIPISMGK
jgi:hypothetical protein